MTTPSTVPSRTSIAAKTFLCRILYAALLKSALHRRQLIDRRQRQQPSDGRSGIGVNRGEHRGARRIGSLGLRDGKGARLVRRQLPDALLVFLKPPSWDELERRLRGRGTEPAEVIAARLATARIELAAEEEFDATVVNTSVAEAAEALVDLIYGH